MYKVKFVISTPGDNAFFCTKEFSSHDKARKGSFLEASKWTKRGFRCSFVLPSIEKSGTTKYAIYDKIGMLICITDSIEEVQEMILDNDNTYHVLN